MSIVLVRIDDRLIHGQIVEGWVPYLKIERVVVASAAAAADDVQKALMRLALPEAVELHVEDPVCAARALKEAQTDRYRTLVLTPGPQEILALLDAGVRFDRVNVGGLHYTVGRVQLGRAIFLSEDDKRALRAIAKKGLCVEGRGLPSDREQDIIALLGTDMEGA